MPKMQSLYARCRKYVFLAILCIVTLTICSVYTYNSGRIQLFSVAYVTGAIRNKTMLTLNEHFNPDSGSVKDVPKVIYMLWDKGWAKAPRLQSLCLKSFRRHNADFNIKTINLTEAEMLINRGEHYTDRAWKIASIQAKSDIIRVEVLARYGGIWADASVYCNEPISNWLNDSLLPTKFLALERKDRYVSEQNSPWIASWFLVATTNSDMMQTWRDRVRQAWTEDIPPPKTLGYFWVHRLFRNLVISNSTFRTMFHNMPFVDAGLPHCWGPKGVLPHMYKIKAKSCSKVRKGIFAKENII